MVAEASRIEITGAPVGFGGRSSAARAGLVAWPALCLAFALSALAATFILAMLSTPIPPRLGFRGWVPIAAILYAVVGARVATRQPRNPVGWLILAVGVAYAANTLAEEYAHWSMYHEFRMLPFADYAAAYANTAPSIIGTLGAFAYLLFPDGRLPSLRWLPVAALVAILGSVTIVGYALAPRTLAPYGIANPLTPSDLWLYRPEAVRFIDSLYGVRVAVLVIPVISLVIRLLTAQGARRQQMKWVTSAGLASTALFGLWAAGVRDPLVGQLLALSIIAVPVALWIAISRHRLYDIDRILNRAFVYTTLTATLAGVYIASIGLTQRVFTAVTGERSDAAIVVTTLVVAAIFTPLRGSLQAVADRRVQRRRAAGRGFAAFRSEIETHRVLSDPSLLLARLVDEAVGELDATGGALELNGCLECTCGAWSGDERLVCAFRMDGHVTARVLLGPRLNGQPYTEANEAALREVAERVATLIELLQRQARGPAV